MKCVRERRVRVAKDIIVIISIWAWYVREVPHHVAVDSEREVRDGGDLPKVVRRDEEDGYCGAYGGDQQIGDNTSAGVVCSSPPNRTVTVRWSTWPSE